MTLERKHADALHPALMAIVPILLLAAANAAQLEARLLWLPLLASLVLMATILLVWYAVFRRLYSAAILTSLSLGIFFSHGHIVRTIQASNPDIRSRYIHLALLFCWTILIAVAFLFVRTRRDRLASISRFFTISLTILLCITIARLGASLRAASIHRTKQMARAVPMARLQQSSLKDRDRTDIPDVYYIILDGYPRSDILAEAYELDNSDFLEFLEASGFYVADQSRSNYATTYLSLASSLNLRYINADCEAIGSDSKIRTPIYDLLRSHAIGQIAKQHGYKFIHFNTNWGGTERSGVADIAYPKTLPEFHRVLLETTMLEPLAWRLPSLSRAELTEYHLNKLEEIARLPEPTFTFAHIICPHPPFYFAADGTKNLQDASSDWKDKEAFRGQVVFLNRQIQRVVDELIHNVSGPPPIIIIQGDHGTASRFDESLPLEVQHSFIQERMSILNALYVPPEMKRQLYPDISPVNSLRLLANTLFDTKLELLPDRSYFSWDDRPYRFIDATEIVRSKQQRQQHSGDVKASARHQQIR